MGTSILLGRTAALLCLLALLGCAAPGPEPDAAEASAPTPTPGVSEPSAAPSPDPEPAAPARPAAAQPDGQLVVRFLDVGQGDATLLQAPDATMLIDTGRHDRDDLLGQLAAYGVDHIDVVAITHGHADHIGGLDRVLDSLAVTEVWMPGTTHTTATFERAVTAIERSDAAYEEPRAGDHTTVGSLQVDVLGPQQLTGDLHADSLVLRVTHGAVAFLFTGDAEAETEAELVARDPGLLAATVYQVGHHGSRTSTTTGFLAAVDPRVAVYSAGAGNSYGHPHAEVIDRLEAAGVAVYGTDRHGTVTITTDGATYEVDARRVAAAPPAAAPHQPDDEPPAAVAPAGCAPGQVDINSAEVGELERVVHIGAERAAQILDLRPFGSVDELVRVRGIAEARLADIKSQGVACVT